MKPPVTFPEVFSLRGEHALITGGGTGIGLAVAKAMHAAGARGGQGTINVPSWSPDSTKIAFVTNMDLN